MGAAYSSNSTRTPLLRRVLQKGGRNRFAVERLHEIDQAGRFRRREADRADFLGDPAVSCAGIGTVVSTGRIVSDYFLERRLLTRVHVRRRRCDAAETLGPELAHHRRVLRETGEL